MERFSVSSVENDSAPQFFPQERFEKGEDHLKDVGLIDDVDVLDSQRYTVLLSNELFIRISGMKPKYISQFEVFPKFQ